MEKSDYWADLSKPCPDRSRASGIGKQNTFTSQNYEQNFTVTEQTMPIGRACRSFGY